MFTKEYYDKNKNDEYLKRYTSNIKMCGITTAQPRTKRV